jgi:hypothetical protein
LLDRHGHLAILAIPSSHRSLVRIYCISQLIQQVNKKIPWLFASMQLLVTVVTATLFCFRYAGSMKYTVSGEKNGGGGPSFLFAVMSPFYQFGPWFILPN